jgi:hypothetical protein
MLWLIIKREANVGFVSGFDSLFVLVGLQDHFFVSRKKRCKHKSALSALTLLKV